MVGHDLKRRVSITQITPRCARLGDVSRKRCSQPHPSAAAGSEFPQGQVAPRFQRLPQLRAGFRGK